MKSRLLLFLFCALLVSNVGLACNLVLCYEANLQGYTDITAYMPDKSCLSVELRCGTCNGQKIKVSHCIACDSNYEWYEKNEIVSGGLTVSYGSCRFKQNDCDNCGGECRGEHYVPVENQPGYQSIYNETCNSLLCKCQNMSTLKYKCAPGYRQVLEKVSCDTEGCKGCKECFKTDNVYGADKNENCITSIDWVRYSEGYEYWKYAKFNSEDCSCEITKEYRCAAGWYGTAFYNFLNRGMDGCSQCLTVGNIIMDKNLKEKARGTSTAGNNLNKDSCYLPDGTYYMKSGTVEIKNKYSSMCTY